MSRQNPDPADEVLAAELAFGLLEPEEARVVEARRARDADFDRLCATWCEHAAALLDGGDTAPGLDLWARISARLPANDPAEVVVLRKAVGRWRAAAAGLGMVAAVLGGALFSGRQGRPPTPAPVRVAAVAPVVVILKSADRQAIVSISFDPATNRYSVASDAFETGSHSAELWVIPADHVPRSLGLVSAARRTGQIARLEGARKIAPGATLAISLEPLGGSKTGKPTGPVVLSGTV